VGICGNGTLTDGSKCSKEFREFLKNVPSRMLRRYTEQCLEGGPRTSNSGLILQDLVNEIGDRLGFVVEPGPYHGSTNRVGNDGLWKSTDQAFLLEVKTSDLSVKLQNIAGYREKLIASAALDEEHSSILIVLGRQDTGDLEAQIRGSRYAWNIRMIGVEALLRLLEIKENLNDRQTIYRITELLKPIEYTRVDKLIEVVFSASADVAAPQDDSVPADEITLTPNTNQSTEQGADSVHVRKHASPVNFYEKCIARINEKLKKRFVKDGRVTYSSSDKTANLVILNSKEHSDRSSTYFWYGFRPNQEEFLTEKPLSYIAFGCGGEDAIVLIPFSEFQQYLPAMLETRRNGDLTHRHVVITKTGSQFLLRLNDRAVDLSRHVL